MAPALGLNWISDLHTDVGVGEAARLFHHALNVGQIPYHHVPIHFDLGLPSTSSTIDINSQPEIFPTSLLFTNADITPHFSTHMASAMWSDVYRIGYWFWELQDLPAHVKQAFAHLNEIWVSSTYSQSALSRISPIPVVHMPLPISVPPIQGHRAAFGLPEDRFLFLYSFNPASSIARKNPFGVIEAFRRAFGSTPRSHKPCLVIKAHHIRDERDGNLRADLQAALDELDGILITETLDRQQTFALTHVCDAYISLHRAEGLGLGMAEAMALGKPVIATAYSGNLDFMSPQNSALVNYQLRAIRADDHRYQPDYLSIYEPGQMWAEPDLDHAAWWMQHLVDHPIETQTIGQQAQRSIAQHHSPQNTAEKIAQRLAHLPQHLRVAGPPPPVKQPAKRIRRRLYELAYGSRRVLRQEGIMGFVRQTGRWIAQRVHITHVQQIKDISADADS